MEPENYEYPNFSVEYAQPTDAMDTLTELFNHNTSVEWKPKLHFIQDLDIIIEELSKIETLINIDIYEVLVSCGHRLTWDREYYISMDDLKWLQNDGKNYFINKIHTNHPLLTMDEYNCLMGVHNYLCEVFELQLE